MANEAQCLLNSRMKYLIQVVQFGNLFELQKQNGSHNEQISQRLLDIGDKRNQQISCVSFLIVSFF